MYKFFQKFFLFIKILNYIFKLSLFINFKFYGVFEQISIVGPGSVFITMITSFFIGLVFSIQIVKEFFYLNAVHLVGSILAISFIRELSPILTSIILIGKIGSYFTAELATMIMTEQIDALYIIGINPISHLILPRVIAVLLMLPMLNIFSIFISLISSSFVCYILFNIHPQFFLISAISSCSFLDIIKSSFKTFIFGFFISFISCIWGITSIGGAKGVGLSTTSSVVTSLFCVFMLDFILSYYMFNNLDGLFQNL
uniref:ABC transporter permease n=1 Tax=Sonderella linearis TaxID=110477 RepID=A0A1Z1MMJ2_9FLOR|nr:hypothetical protein [Sonderella linearis]ARW66971.1 hypothetical protein [Sonderella linearis]